MASYSICLKRSAEKELRNIHASDRQRIVERIRALADDPQPAGAQMLKGGQRYLRIRQGDYRLVYAVNDAGHEMTIIKVGHRREVYD